MSSHHDWAEEIVEVHQQTCPYAPENGTPLAFRVGDRVKYIGDDGFEYERVFVITGLYRPDPVTSLYASGFRYLLNWTAPWMPAKESSLQSAII